MTTDVSQIKTRLEQVVSMYQANGLDYGMADVVTPGDTEQDKMLVCLFITVLDKLGCMPFSILKEEVTKRAALVSIETQGKPEMKVRTRIYFRIDGEPLDDRAPTEPAPPNAELDL